MRLPDDPRGIPCLQVWWVVIRESTSSACFSPGSFIAWSLSKQNTWSPLQMASACWVQSETLLATRYRVWAGDSTAPTPSSSHHLGSPTAHVCSPRPCSSRPLPPSITTSFTTKAPAQPSLLRAGGNKVSFQKHFFQSPELILIGQTWVTCPLLSQSMWWGVVSILTGRLGAGAGSTAVNFQ